MGLQGETLLVTSARARACACVRACVCVCVYITNLNLLKNFKYYVRKIKYFWESKLETCSKFSCGNSYSAATWDEIAEVDLFQVEKRAPFPDSRLIIINNNNNNNNNNSVSKLLLFLFFRYQKICSLVPLFRMLRNIKK
jgi:hypothetical protein